MAVGEKTTTGHNFWIATATVDPASLAANTTVDITVTVTGARYDATLANVPDKVIRVIPPSALNTGLAIVGAYVSAADTVVMRLMNCTVGAIDAASGVYEFLFARF